jgi:glutaconyl-CoA/methylmalonyl-CoA decarboxylase subunit gamma
MPKNFRITVDGRSYDVIVEELDQPAEPAVPRAAAIAPAAVTQAPAAQVRAPAPAAGVAPAAGDARSITAPIGGVVRSVDVAIGRVVSAGDKVAIIEAMKMKTEVVSKIAGKITDIAARVNEPVETGQVLMTVE